MKNNQDDFKVVRKRNRKSKSCPQAKGSSFNIERDEEIDSIYTLKKLLALRKEISVSKFYLNSSEHLKICFELLDCSEDKKLVCFGIGSFGSCLIALHQLAFILEIISEHQINDIKFYDPVLSDAEKCILQQLGCEIIPENCEGKYSVDSITVFYMPHCPKQLANNLLWKNWNCKSLSRIILMGNSFENMRQNTPERFLKFDAEYILRSLEWVTEIPLENVFQFEDIFNDMSIHVFPEQKLKKVGEEEWQKSVEPKYSDAELITVDLAKNLNIRMATATLRRLLSELRLASPDGTIKNSLAAKYILAQFRKYKTTDQQLCKAREEMHFLGKTYLCYMESIRIQDTINSAYKGRGERTVKETAELVGFKLPSDPK